MKRGEWELTIQGIAGHQNDPDWKTMKGKEINVPETEIREPKGNSHGFEPFQEKSRSPRSR